MTTIAIIGSGFSGTALAVQLSRLARPGGLRVLLIDRDARPRGVAYSTDHALHVLNVPAGRMGAFPDNEGDFLRWLQREEPSVTGDSFVPRARFGAYLESLRAQAVASAASTTTIECVTGEVASVSHDTHRAVVRLAGGETLEADRVVLAIGNLPPRPLPFASASLHESHRYLADPWAPGALARVSSSLPILVIGTGLTMVDIVLALHERGHRAGFLAVSRHGLLPLSHRDWPHQPPALVPPAALAHWDGSASTLLRMIRAASREAARAGLDWRDVTNGLRSLTPSLWRRMPERERARFVRHIRPYWEIHRHRMSTRVAARVNSLLATSELVVTAGRVVSCVANREGVEVEMIPRGAGTRARHTVGAVINCTGPDSDFAHCRVPVVAGLREAGLLMPDALALGFRTADDGAVIDARGRASSWLFAIGGPRRADLWESTAVPELRVQARDLAARVAS